MKNSFILPCTALVLSQLPAVPPYFPLLPFSVTLGGLPVRLSSWGFHLVIFPLGIHTTPLPPEASCLNTDSPKETSHCHFSSHTLVAHFLALISPSSLMSFYLFLAYSLLCCLSSCPSLCLPMFCHLPPPKLFDSVCISNCVKAASCYGCWDGRGGNLWRAVDLAEVTGSYS